MTNKIYHIDQIKVLGITPEFHQIGYANIQENLPKVPLQKRIKWSRDIKSNRLFLVGYGPSLRKSWEYIKTDPDAHIMTMSGAHDLLIEKGIIPMYHIDCDPRPHKAEFTKHPHKEVKYLMASSCHPTTIDQLLDYDLALWNLQTTAEFIYPRDELIFPGMGSVGLQSLLIGHALGYRKFTILGMDSSFDRTTHAGYHPRSSAQGERLKVAVGDYAAGKKADQYEVFETTQLLVVYAKEMYRWITETLTDCEIEVYGNGLLPAYIAYEDKKRRIQSIRQEAQYEKQS